MNHRFLGVAVVGLLFVATPGFAVESLSDDEMDRLSASGDPVVLQAKGATDSEVAYSDSSNFELLFDVPHAQSGIRALTVQNVVGELQLLVNLNVLSASQNVAGTDQRNFSLQSWGSTLPDPNTVKTVSASAAAAPCAGVGNCNPIGSHGDGPFAKAAVDVKGNAAAAVSTAISPAASASADVIVNAESSGGSARAAVDNAPSYKLEFAQSQAQSDISALFVSNVVGRAQMALNLNIAAAQLNLIPGNSSDPFTNPLGSAGPGVIKQVNTGIQFRGTPLVGSSGTTSNLATNITHLNQ
ncbi:MAG TPA: hypothetical protein VGJ57_10935 [Nitrospirales bacterium]|jgi:hypothetical protein